MFGGGNKIKLDPDLIDRIKKVAEVAGYASHEEFIVHVLEKELAQFEGSDSDADIVYFQNDITSHVFDVHALAAGARLFEASPVRALRRDGAAHLVTTERGHVRADAVVLACGGYIDGLVPRLAGATVPIATAIVVTEPLGARLRAAIRCDGAIHDIRRTGNYYRVLADGRLLWGGGMTAWTHAPRRLAARMLGDLVSTYPQFAGVRAETAWSGLMAYARHQMPQIGRLRPGLWYATGFGGHGMNTTPMAGELIAAAIAEGDDRYRLFAPFGLTRTFGPLGAAAAQATYWYYGFRDTCF